MGPSAHTSPLGLIEWDGIAAGIEAADAVLKESPVEPLVLRAIAPGRYLAAFVGAVDEVRAALAAGLRVGGTSVVDHLFLPAPHPQLLAAVGGGTGRPARESIGVIETKTVCSLLGAADGAAKEGDVHLLDIRLAMGIGGKGFCVLTGPVGDVEAAVARGRRFAEARGFHVRSVVIHNPDARTADLLVEPFTPFSDLLL